MTLTSPYLPGLVVPIVFIIVGAICKKLVRSGAFIRADFFMGVELSLAAFSSELIYLIEAFQKPNVSSDAVRNAHLGVSVASFGTFVLLIAVFGLHQSFMKDGVSAKTQYLALTFFSNLLGTGAMTLFIAAKEGKLG
jgi:hypothetical protein